jgi:hypothetical protein
MLTAGIEYMSLLALYQTHLFIPVIFLFFYFSRHAIKSYQKIWFYISQTNIIFSFLRFITDILLSYLIFLDL